MFGEVILKQFTVMVHGSQERMLPGAEGDSDVVAKLVVQGDMMDANLGDICPDRLATWQKSMATN